MTCPFCERVAAGAVETATNRCAAFDDAYPLSAGHALVIPKRHVARLDELERDEYLELWSLVDRVRRSLAHADGFNVGVNDGESAGQTVSHVHVHVIPRRAGDAEDPRGGIRWVLPDRAAYWDGV